MKGLRAALLATTVLACRTSTPGSSSTTVTIPAAPTASASVEPVTSSLPQPGAGARATADNACRADSECAIGEIGREILKPADCPCLLGCPYIPMNKTTLARRQAAYERLCKPGVNGAGHPCPIDDCAAPPKMICDAGVCAPKR
jgi:hypothetical protein